MKLSGIKTVVQISEATDIEKEMLKASGFQDSGRRDSCGNELWEHKLGILLLILSEHGSLRFMKMGNPGKWIPLWLEKFQNIHYTV